MEGRQDVTMFLWQTGRLLRDWAQVTLVRVSLALGGNLLALGAESKNETLSRARERVTIAIGDGEVEWKKSCDDDAAPWGD